MRRFFLLACGLGLLLAACGDGAATTTAPPTTTVTTTTVAPPTTAATTTAVTTTAPTTTQPLIPVTTHPGLPTALSRSLIPVEAIDQGWVVVLYSAERNDFSAPGPSVLYLVSPQGDRYELAAYQDGTRAAMPASLSNDGTHVYAITWLDTGVEVVSIDVATGLSESVAAFESAPGVRATLPTGRDVVVSSTTFDPASERLEVYRTSGVLLAEIAVKDSEWPSYTWLYGLDGTFLVVGDGETLEVVRNDGTAIRSLDTPAAQCEPVRWWDEATILAACVPDEVAENMGYYHVLWLVHLDGSAPFRLTVDPPADLNVVDFGNADAWRVGDRTLLQWYGDCGARAIQVLQPDGTGEWLEVGVPGGPWIDAQSGDDLVISTMEGCDGGNGEVHLIRPDGTLVRTLVPVIPGYRGVTAVAAMIPTP